MLIARPSPATSYTTVSVAPGVLWPVVEGVLGNVGTGNTGVVGRGVVVGDEVVRLGAVSDGSGATTVSCRELLTITSAITRTTTVRIAISPTIHNQRGDFGPSVEGGWGSSPGGYCGPYCPVAYGS